MSGPDQPRLISEVPLDAHVLTADRQRLGTVREVRVGFFKIQAARHTNYWLPMHTVASVADDEVVLRVSDSRLADYQLAEPRAV
jgi:hypothetical protein